MTEDNGTPRRARGNKSAQPSPARACRASRADDTERITNAELLVEAAWDFLLAELDGIDREYADAIAKSDDDDEGARELEQYRQMRFGKIDKKFRADAKLVLRTLLDAVAPSCRTEPVAILADARKRGNSHDWLAECELFLGLASMYGRSPGRDAHEGVTMSIETLLADLREIDARERARTREPGERSAKDLTPEDVREAWKLSKGNHISLAGRLAERCHAFAKKDYRTARHFFAVVCRTGAPVRRGQ